MSNETPRQDLGMIDSFLRNQTPYLQGSIVHADQKATFLLLILGILLGYLGRESLLNWAVGLGQWQRWDTIVAGISLVAAGFFLGSGIWAGRVVMPRFRDAPEGSSSFVAIATEFQAPDDFATHLLALENSVVLRKQLKAHRYRCGVCLKKWALLERAYKLSAAGLLLLLLGFLCTVLHGWKLLP